MPFIIFIFIYILKQDFAANIWAQEGCEWRVAKVHSLYRSLNIFRVIKFRRLRWTGHVAQMEEGRSAFKILTGKPTENNTFRKAKTFMGGEY